MDAASKKVKDPEPDAKSLEVRIENEDDGDVDSFEVKPKEELGKVIAKFYKKLRRERRPDDRLRCEKGGEDVFPFEDETFARYLDEGHCPKLRWVFAGGTGGA